MKPKLFFGLSLDFNLTLNEQLKNLAVLSHWDPGLQKRMYIFSLDRLKEISSLINEPMLFEAIDITKLIHYSNQTTQEVEIEQWKGKSGYEIIEFPRIYHVVSYQKPKGGEPRKQTHSVNKDTLIRVWKVYQNLEKDKFYDFAYITEHICKEFGLTRFFRPTSESFDKEKYQGTRPSHEYGTYYYYPVVVLDWLGLIERKGRFSKRVKDVFEEQSKFERILRKKYKIHKL